LFVFNALALKDASIDPGNLLADFLSVQIFGTPTDDLRGGNSEERGHGWIHVGVSQIRIHDEDAFRSTFKHRAEAFFAFTYPFSGLFLPRDVSGEDRDSVYLAIGSNHGIQIVFKELPPAFIFKLDGCAFSQENSQSLTASLSCLLSYKIVDRFADQFIRVTAESLGSRVIDHQYSSFRIYEQH
jgi:hypothetical protein